MNSQQSLVKLQSKCKRNELKLKEKMKHELLSYLLESFKKSLSSLSEKVQPKNLKTLIKQRELI